MQSYQREQFKIEEADLSNIKRAYVDNNFIPLGLMSADNKSYVYFLYVGRLFYALTAGEINNNRCGDYTNAVYRNDSLHEETIPAVQALKDIMEYYIDKGIFPPFQRR